MEQAMNLTMQEIADACKGKLVLQGDADRQVTGVVLDSRLVTEGSVFLATVGERVDGHRFAVDVFQKGACLVIGEKTPQQVEEEHGVCAANWGSFVLVEDTLQALRDIATYYRKKLQIPFVGITGSVGKTSTKEFIATVLSQKYKVLKTEGNYNNEIGVPLTLLRIRPEHEVAVIEMGISDFGEMHRLSAMVQPNVAVITNIGQCHLENLGDRDGVLKAKTELFDFLQEDGDVCLNGEDDKLITVQQVHGKKTHFFGLLPDAAKEVYADQVVSKGLWGSEAVLHRKEKASAVSFPVSVPLPGRHMVVNASAAACVAGLFGLTDEQIAAGIASVQAVDGRTHLIRLADYTVIDDCYNANPVSMKSALDLLAMATVKANEALAQPGGRVAILGDMFELGENSDAMHGEVGAYAANSGIEHLWCVGANSRQMYESAVAVQKEKGAASDSTQKIRYFANRDELCKALAQDQILPANSTILVKASHGMGFAKVVEQLTQNKSACSFDRSLT